MPIKLNRCAACGRKAVRDWNYLGDQLVYTVSCTNKICRNRIKNCDTRLEADHRWNEENPNPQKAAHESVALHRNKVRTAQALASLTKPVTSTVPAEYQVPEWVWCDEERGAPRIWECGMCHTPLVDFLQHGLGCAITVSGYAKPILPFCPACGKSLGARS